jgi:hypothetical protein
VVVLHLGKWGWQFQRKMAIVPSGKPSKLMINLAGSKGTRFSDKVMEDLHVFTVRLPRKSSETNEIELFCVFFW